MGKIVQIIPASRPIVAVYGEEGKIDWISNVDYLALTDDGEVCGLDLSLDGDYDICTGMNFVGLCEVENIYRFLKYYKLTKIYNDEKGENK